MNEPTWTHPVLFFANGIGDAVLALPTLRAALDAFSSGVTLVTREASYVDLFRPLRFRSIICLRTGTKHDWDPDEIAAVATELFDCDLFVSLTPWQSASLHDLRRRLKPSLSVGFSPEYDVHVPLQFDCHSALLMFRAIQAVAPSRNFFDFAGPVELPPQSVELARQITCLAEGTKIVAVHTETLVEKLWPSERWSACLETFLADRGDFLAIDVNAEEDLYRDREPTDRILPHMRLRLCDAMAIVQRSSLFVGIDSCMLHVADFSRVPSVALFGPTCPREFGFLLAPNVSLRADGSLADLGVERVIEAMRSIQLGPEHSV